MCCVLFVVLCIVCCVSQYCVVPTIRCKSFQQKFVFFLIKPKFILCKIIKCFFECCRFLNVCMQCSVDVTESVVERLLRVWCRFAVIPLAGLSRRSAGRWRQGECHATNHNNFIYQPIFTIQQSAGYNHTKKD